MTIDMSQGAVSTQNRILRRLLDVSLVLNSSLAIEPLLRYIMDSASEITNSQAASILLIDRHTNELYFAATNTPGAEQQMAHIPVPLDNSIAGTVIRDNKAVIIQDASRDPRINRTVDQQIAFQTRSLMGVPMRIKDDVIGALEVVNRIGSEWTDDDCSHLIILAAQAAVAIENARQAEELRKAYEELDKLDKLKNDFIAVASHELRTPLSIIIGYSSFLQEEAQGAASEHAAAVLNSAQHLGDIIEELTNLRYLRVGTTELNLSLVSLISILQAVQRETETLANAKNQRFEVIYPGLTEVVEVDAAMVEMALTNVLNNAVKFTAPGGKIKIYTERHGTELWIRVKDTGIGIPPDQLEDIFKDFYQVAEHMTRKYNGMGLGLSIARAVVAANHGRIWAESEGTGHGACFTISLPIRR
jgi:signal transduction histidine kinase